PPAETPPSPFPPVPGTSLTVCPPTSSRARMSRKADAAVSVIWSIALTPSRRGLCVYPHERMGHLDIDGLCSAEIAGKRGRPSAGVRPIQVPVPNHGAEPHRLLDRSHREPSDRALTALVIAVQRLDAEEGGASAGLG